MIDNVNTEIAFMAYLHAHPKNSPQYAGRDLVICKEGVQGERGSDFWDTSKL